MEVKKAVLIAKQYIADLFAEEGAKNIGLEEVEFSESDSVWNVTIGFSRALNEPLIPSAITMLGLTTPTDRVYKIVRIRDIDGQPLAVKTH